MSADVTSIGNGPGAVALANPPGIAGLSVALIKRHIGLYTLLRPTHIDGARPVQPESIGWRGTHRFYLCC